MSLREFLRGTALTAALAGSMIAGRAEAADLDPALEDPAQDISAMPVSNVVFGTGWYVRGDLGGVQLYQTNPFAQRTTSYNYMSAATDAPVQALKRSHELGYVADLGAGYSFTSWFRTDVTVGIHQPSHSSKYGKPFNCQNGFGTPKYQGIDLVSDPTYGSCNGIYEASIQSYHALVNAYFDLGTWYRVTPYIGVGVGLGFGHYQASSNYIQADGSSYNINVQNPISSQAYHLYFDRNNSGNYYNFAYAAMAGVAFQVFDHTKLDIGYRYLNQGRVLGTTLDEHEVRAGLRYMIDN